MDLDRSLGLQGTLLERREFLAALSGAAVGLLAPGPDAHGGVLLSGCLSDHPVQCLLERKMPTLVAFIDAQLHCLWNGCPAESAREVACDVVRFVSHLPLAAQQAICLTLVAVDFHAIKNAKRRLHRLPVYERVELLNQGEYQTAKRRYPLVTWDTDFSFHTAVGSLALLVRLVTNSRVPARQLIGLRWSPQCTRPENLVHMPAPPYPDLSIEYDVCVIGSGAGGSVVAARAAEAGLSVLIVEEGEWISPDGLVQRIHDEHGAEIIWPARDDEGLMHLFQGCGVNLAGRLGDPEVDQRSIEQYLEDEGVPGLTVYSKLKKARPRQTINVLQPRVVGGGPYINNAIFLEIDEEIWLGWPSRPPQSSYADLYERMQQIKTELGVNREASLRYSGERTRAFVEACNAARIDVEPLPVSIRAPADDVHAESCAVCGSDNIVDPFGQHIGGLHPLRDGEPNSYLMRAIAAGAQVAYETRAWRFDVRSTDGPAHRAVSLLVEDRRGVCTQHRGPGRRVRARAYVLAAGAVASTLILGRTAQSQRIAIHGLGCNFTANVVTPVYAVFDQPIYRGGNVPEPGIAQCFYVRKTPDDGTGNDEPALENWFHYPGSLAIALTGWFCEYASVMRHYDHISICGMVVPTKVRPENRIECNGKTHLTIDRDEFELLLRGIHKISRIYLAAATPDNGVTLYLPTKGLLLDSCGRPVRIRDLACLDWAIHEIRRRGPEFLNLATAHPQGGNSLGIVVDPQTFRPQDACQRPIENVYVADASLFPAGCAVNPQLTVHALATYAADSLLSQFASDVG